MKITIDYCPGILKKVNCFFKKCGWGIAYKRIREIETLRDKAYEDKLKGVIDEEYFNGRYNQWTKDIADFREELSTIESKNDEILHRCVLTFELANQARNLYKKQVPEQKARFLKMLLSNSFLKDGKLQFEFKKPFDMLVGMSKKPEMSVWLALVDDVRTKLLWAIQKNIVVCIPEFKGLVG